MFCVIRCFASSAAVYDEIGLLDAEDFGKVSARASEVSAASGRNIDVYITDCGLSESELHDYCDKLYKKNHGYRDDGMLFLCDEEWVYICAFGNTANYMTSSRANDIATLGNSYYSEDPAKSIIMVLDGIEDYYAVGLAEDKDKSFVKAAAIGALCAVAAALITFAAVHHSYKKHEIPDTNMYLDHNTLNFDTRQDIFEREYVTRTHRSSSSGGGRSVGGGSHR